jgi:hypothetical protein
VLTKTVTPPRMCSSSLRTQKDYAQIDVWSLSRFLISKSSKSFLESASKNQLEAQDVLFLSVRLKRYHSILTCPNFLRALKTGNARSMSGVPLRVQNMACSISCMCSFCSVKINDYRFFTLKSSTMFEINISNREEKNECSVSLRGLIFCIYRLLACLVFLCALKDD